MKILIIGATSAIAKASARLYAARKAQLFLIARNEELLIELKEDLMIRGARAVAYYVLDLSNQKNHGEALEQARQSLEKIDIALLCHGSLPDQEACENDYNRAKKEINVNGLSIISLCTELSKVFKAQQSGVLAVITSVAGDRGRQPNFIYGAAKSMVSTYLQGLRGKLLAHKVHVIDIKPGLVDSPMTSKFNKGLLWSTPELVANKIVRGIDRKNHTVYVPGYWRIIMATVCLIPEFIFKRLKI